MAFLRRHVAPARFGAVLFGLLALAAVLAWVFVDSSATDAWMPNAATGSATIALTITFVDWILRSSERQRARPRRENAERILIRHVHDLVDEMHAIDQFTHRDQPPVPLVASVHEEVKRFVGGLETESFEPPEENGRDALAAWLKPEVKAISQLRALDSDYLDHAVVVAVDQYLRGLDLVQTAFDASVAKPTKQGRRRARLAGYEILAERLLCFVDAVKENLAGIDALPAATVERLNEIYGEPFPIM